MRTFMLLVLTLVAVAGSRLEEKSGKILLKETIESLTEIIDSECQHSKPTTIGKKFVPDIYHARNCSNKTFCQAQKALKNIFPSMHPLRRHLHAYAEHVRHENCSVSASIECTVCELLQKTRKCCKDQFHKMHTAWHK